MNLREALKNKQLTIKALREAKQFGSEEYKMAMENRWRRMALRNIAEAHGLSEINKEDESFYLETNHFFSSEEACRGYYEESFDYLIQENKIIRTADGLVAVNVV